MKLSTAIRLGAMLKPQGYGVLFQPILNVTCAIGAALDANGDIGEAFDEWCGCRTAAAMWPILATEAQHPIDGELVNVYAAIAELNDMTRWTRERIALWIESIEPHDAEQVLPLAAPVAVEA